jgi:hypothetical protein
MALSIIDLLSTVVATLLTTYRTVVLIDWESTILALSLGVAPELDAQALADSLILSKVPSMRHFLTVVVDGGPSREVVGKHAPLAAPLLRR